MKTMVEAPVKSVNIARFVGVYRGRWNTMTDQIKVGDRVRIINGELFSAVPGINPTHQVTRVGYNGPNEVLLRCQYLRSHLTIDVIEYV